MKGTPKIQQGINKLVCIQHLAQCLALSGALQIVFIHSTDILEPLPEARHCARLWGPGNNTDGHSCCLPGVSYPVGKKALYTQLYE